MDEEKRENNEILIGSDNRELEINNKTFVVYFREDNDISYYEVMLDGNRPGSVQKIQFNKIRFIDLEFIKLGTVLFISDVVSDIVLSFRYLFEKEWIYGLLTLLLVIYTSVANTFIFDKKQAYWRKEENRNWSFYLLSPFYFLFNGDIIIRYYRVYNSAINYVNRQSTLEQQIELYDKFYNERIILNEGKNWESGFESIPQVILQFYIIIQSINVDKFDINSTDYFQFFSLMFSFLGCICTFFTFHKYDSVQINFENTTKNCLRYSFSCTMFLFCRAASIAAGLSVKIWYLVVGGMFCHWICFSSWYFKKGTPILNAILSATGFTIFTFYRNSTFRIILHGVIFCENIIFMYIWMNYTKTSYDTFKTWFFYTNFIVDLLCRFIYVHYNNKVFQKNKI